MYIFKHAPIYIGAFPLTEVIPAADHPPQPRFLAAPKIIILFTNLPANVLTAILHYFIIAHSIHNLVDNFSVISSFPNLHYKIFSSSNIYPPLEL